MGLRAEEELLERGWSSYPHTTISRGKSFMPELTNRAVEMAEGVGWDGLDLGVGGDDAAAAAAAAVVEEGDVEEEDDEVDDECGESVLRTRNLIVACCARTLRSERSR